MFGILRTGACLAVALAAAPVAWTAPAHAACRVEGDAYRIINDHPGDPTGPSVYIKRAPEDGFTYFVRLRDGWQLFRMLERSEPIRIAVEGDAHSCPTDGVVRDLGTAVDGVTVLQSAAAAPVRPAP